MMHVAYWPCHSQGLGVAEEGENNEMGKEHISSRTFYPSTSLPLVRSYSSFRFQQSSDTYKDKLCVPNTNFILFSSLPS